MLPHADVWPQAYWTHSDGNETGSAVFDTVLLAVGRHAVTSNVGLDTVGVKVHALLPSCVALLPDTGR